VNAHYRVDELDARCAASSSALFKPIPIEQIGLLKE
jgi:hypothetical protein